MFPKSLIGASYKSELLLHLCNEPCGFSILKRGNVKEKKKAGEGIGLKTKKLFVGLPFSTRSWTNCNISKIIL